MSTGKNCDRGLTIEQLRKPTPQIGLTWLRHRIDCQSGQIDLMLLEGTSSIEEMASTLKNNFPSRDMGDLIKRVQDHIAHLQDGDARDLSSLHTDDNHKPHGLSLKAVDGKWCFDL